MNDLKQLQEETNKLKSKHYYIIECPHCHSKLCVEHSEIEYVMFEPIEKEFDAYKIYDDNGDTSIIPHKQKCFVSSDKSKDLYKIELCCVCGHRQIVLTDDEFKRLEIVGWDGTNTIHFNLDEAESEEARKFIQEHKDCCMNKLGKKFFSSTGGQYTYKITPTGLGNMINIECNACKESKDITNTDNL